MYWHCKEILVKIIINKINGLYNYYDVSCKTILPIKWRDITDPNFVKSNKCHLKIIMGKKLGPNKKSNRTIHNHTRQPCLSVLQAEQRLWHGENLGTQFNRNQHTMFVWKCVNKGTVRTDDDGGRMTSFPLHKHSVMLRLNWKWGSGGVPRNYLFKVSLKSFLRHLVSNLKIQ